MMENFNMDNLSTPDEQPLRDLVEKVQYDTLTSAYECIKDMGIDFLIAKGSKRPVKITKGLIEYFQHPDREEYEKCAVLVKAIKRYRSEKDTLKELNTKKQNIKKNTKKL